MRPLHCEGCGMKGVLFDVSSTGSAGGPTLYLCNICADLGGPFVADLYAENPRTPAQILLRTHAKVSRIFHMRFDE